MTRENELPPGVSPDPARMTFIKRSVGKDRRARLGIAPDAKRLTGTIIRIREEGYGFIHAEQGDFYVNIASMRDRGMWREGTRVTFLPGAPRAGKAPPAYDVKALPPLVEAEARCE
jgi:cold shock CspA family protein